MDSLFAKATDVRNPFSGPHGSGRSRASMVSANPFDMSDLKQAIDDPGNILQKLPARIEQVLSKDRQRRPGVSVSPTDIPLNPAPANRDECAINSRASPKQEIPFTAESLFAKTIDVRNPFSGPYRSDCPEPLTISTNPFDMSDLQHALADADDISHKVPAGIENVLKSKDRKRRRDTRSSLSGKPPIPIALEEVENLKNPDPPPMTLPKNQGFGSILRSEMEFEFSTGGFIRDDDMNTRRAACETSMPRLKICQRVAVRTYDVSTGEILKHEVCAVNESFSHK